MTKESRITDPATIEPPVRGWRGVLPPAQWLRVYEPRWLVNDAIAGVTLAAYGIPVSLAYASLAGLPPQCGIYGYLVGGLFYALFGSSRRLAIGPTSAISMLVGRRTIRRKRAIKSVEPRRSSRWPKARHKAGRRLSAKKGADPGRSSGNEGQGWTNRRGKNRRIYTKTGINTTKNLIGKTSTRSVHFSSPIN